MKKNRHRFWIEIQNKEDFSPGDRYVILSEKDFEILREWMSAQARLTHLQPPQVHFWDMSFKSEMHYDA